MVVALGGGGLWVRVMVWWVRRMAVVGWANLGDFCVVRCEEGADYCTGGRLLTDQTGLYCSRQDSSVFEKCRLKTLTRTKTGQKMGCRGG